MNSRIEESSTKNNTEQKKIDVDKSDTLEETHFDNNAEVHISQINIHAKT